MTIFNIRKFGLAALVGATMALAGAANAATFAGKYYDVGGFNVFGQPAFTGTPLVDSATDAYNFLNPGMGPAPTATALFTSSGIDYQSPTSSPAVNNTIGNLNKFLGVDSPSITPASAGGTSFLGTVLTFSGLINLAVGNNKFDVYSDDGFILYIGGNEVARFEGLRAPGTSTININSAGGNVLFGMTYFEGSNTQAALRVKLNNKVLTAVPVPAAGFLLLGALGGLAALRRRKTA